MGNTLRLDDFGYSLSLGFTWSNLEENKDRQVRAWEAAIEDRDVELAELARRRAIENRGDSDLDIAQRMEDIEERRRVLDEDRQLTALRRSEVERRVSRGLAGEDEIRSLEREQALLDFDEARIILDELLLSWELRGLSTSNSFGGTHVE